MRYIKYVIAIMLLFVSAYSGLALADHFGHGGGYGRGHVGIGVVIGGPAWGWPYYQPIYPNFYPVYPPTVVIQSPPVYVEQGVAAPAPAQAAENYWYHCDSPQGYYPYIKECPSGWQRVVPQIPPHP